MPKEILDCVIVGYNDFDLPSLMAAREKLQATSGACRQMLGSVFRYGGKWRHHSELLNAVLKEATGRDHHLHTMELPNLAACHLRSFLARKGLEVESVNFFNREKDRLAAWLRDSPRAVAITTSLYVEADPVAEVVRFVRERSPETLIVVGGPHILNVCDIPSLMAQDHLLNRMGADVYIHDSQGEATLARLLRELRKGDRRALGRVPNLVYRAGPAPGAGRASPYVRTPRQIEDNDVNANAIDWGLIPGALSRPTAQMIISRSCPFACSFCRYPALAGPFRTARVDVVERQMKQLRAAGASRLILADDTPNVPLKRFKAIVKMMVESQLQFQWFSNLRCANADAETYDLLAASGCRGVFLGIESGDQTILDNMNKQATVDAYREGIRQLKARDILTYASFIVGFPGETEDTIRNTIRFIEETGPSYYQVHLYYHSRNVPIQREAKRFGLHGGDYSWRHRTMDWEAACDRLDMMRSTIRGSILSTSYLSSFWLIAYLLGKGVSIENIRAFMHLSASMLVRNADADARTGEGPPESLHGPLMAVAGRIARDLGSGDGSRTA